MVITHTRYQITNRFIGLVWLGVALVGVDVDTDAAGIVFGSLYAGWYRA